MDHFKTHKQIRPRQISDRPGNNRGQEQAFCQPKHSGSGGQAINRGGPVDEHFGSSRTEFASSAVYGTVSLPVLVPDSDDSCVMGFDSYSRTWRILEMQLHPPLLINEDTIRRNPENLTIWSVSMMEGPLIHYLSQSAMASRGQYMSAFMPLEINRQ